MLGHLCCRHSIQKCFYFLIIICFISISAGHMRHKDCLLSCQLSLHSKFVSKYNSFGSIYFLFHWSNYYTGNQHIFSNIAMMTFTLQNNITKNWKLKSSPSKKVMRIWFWPTDAENVVKQLTSAAGICHIGGNLCCLKTWANHLL